MGLYIQKAKNKGGEEEVKKVEAAFKYIQKKWKNNEIDHDLIKVLKKGDG